jgi:hypothetical protein
MYIYMCMYEGDDLSRDAYLCWNAFFDFLWRICPRLQVAAAWKWGRCCRKDNKKLAIHNRHRDSEKDFQTRDSTRESTSDTIFFFGNQIFNLWESGALAGGNQLSLSHVPELRWVKLIPFMCMEFAQGMPWHLLRRIEFQIRFFVAMSRLWAIISQSNIGRFDSFLLREAKI